MDKLLDIAMDNRKKCTECAKKINKNEKYLCRTHHGFRSSHTVNVCMDCIIQMFFDLRLTKEELLKHKKLVILNKLLLKHY